MAKLALLISLCLGLALLSESQRMICHYRNFTTFRPGECSAEPNHLINADYCTHVVYHYVGVTEEGGIYVTSPYSDLCDDYGMCGYERIAYLKTTHPALQVLFWIGYEGMQGTISQVATDATKRANFVAACKDHVKYFNYDGMVLDWNIPYATDTWAFTVLLQDLKNSFSADGLQVAATSYITHVDARYEDGALQIADFVIVGSFWYRGYEAGTWHPSPLYRCNGDWFSRAEIENVDNAVSLHSDVDNDKLIIPAYTEGLSFTLQVPGTNGIAADIAAVGDWHECMETQGKMNYDLTCNDGWESEIDSVCKVEFLVKDDQWIGIETPYSVQEKAQYVKDNGYGGIIIQSYDGDDFDGSCGVEMELHKVAYDTLFP